MYFLVVFHANIYTITKWFLNINILIFSSSNYFSSTVFKIHLIILIYIFNYDFNIGISFVDC